jgi:hypothetical protein
MPLGASIEGASVTGEIPVVFPAGIAIVGATGASALVVQTANRVVLDVNG